MELITFIFLIIPIVGITLLYFKFVLGMTLIDVGSYLKGVYIYSRMWVRGSVFYIVVVLCVIFSVLIYHSDSSLQRLILKWYNTPNSGTDVQLLTLITVVVGFAANYWFSVRANKKKSVLEIRVNQAKELIFFSTQMHHHAVHIQMLCKCLKTYYEYINSGVGKELEDRMVRSVRMAYKKFIIHHNHNEQLQKDFEVYMYSNLFMFSMKAEHNAINRIGELYVDVVHSSNKMFSADFNEVSKFNSYADQHSLASVQEEIECVDELNEKIKNVSQMLCARLMEDVVSCDFSVLFAIVQSPKIFKNKKERVLGYDVIDKRAAQRFYDLMKRIKN